jgi:hypothetical protein
MSNIEIISGAIDEWLREEVAESHAARNSYLDDYAKFAAAYDPNATGVENDDVKKARNHYERFTRLMRLRQDPLNATDDFFIGKTIHHSLMFVSGGFRRECLFLANSQYEYERLRFGQQDYMYGASSIDIPNAVTLAIAQAKTDRDIIGTSIAINEEIYSKQKEADEWMLGNSRRLVDVEVSDLPVTISHERQIHGINLAVGHIVMTAAERGGDLSRVPFLEAKSISDVSQTPYYPLIGSL